jgi:hypothetical protein
LRLDLLPEGNEAMSMDGEMIEAVFEALHVACGQIDFGRIEGPGRSCASKIEVPTGMTGLGRQAVSEIQDLGKGGHMDAAACFTMPTLGTDQVVEGGLRKVKIPWQDLGLQTMIVLKDGGLVGPVQVMPRHLISFVAGLDMVLKCRFNHGIFGNLHFFFVQLRYFSSWETTFFCGVYLSIAMLLKVASSSHPKFK